MDKDLHAIVRGRVQGVGFRLSTLRKAGSLALCGWVMNRDDGTVELVAQGPREALDTLLGWLSCGPAGARVSAVEHTWRARRETFDAFSVRG
jgi:acylphosphatase